MMTALYFNGIFMLVNIARSNVAIIKIPLINYYEAIEDTISIKYHHFSNTYFFCSKIFWDDFTHFKHEYAVAPRICDFLINSPV